MTIDDDTSYAIGAEKDNEMKIFEIRTFKVIFLSKSAQNSPVLVSEICVFCCILIINYDGKPNSLKSTNLKMLGSFRQATFNRRTEKSIIRK